MKRSFLLLCAVLLVLGCALPCAAYRLARMTLAQSTAPSAAEASSAASEEGSGQATSPADTADIIKVCPSERRMDGKGKYKKKRRKGALL